MAKAPKTAAIIPPGLQSARAMAAAALANSTALRRMDRVTVIDEGGFTEFLLDGETIVGGNGPEAVYIREFGRVVEEIKAEPGPKANQAGPLLAALKWMVEVYHEEGVADDKQPEAVKAALVAIGEAEAAS